MGQNAISIAHEKVHILIGVQAHLYICNGQGLR